MQKLAHHGTNDQFRGFARGSQPILESLAPVGFVKGHHGRHVKCFAQERMTNLGQPGLAFHAATRLMLPRVEACECGGLAAVAKTTGIANEGQKDGNGALAQAGDAVEQCLFVLHAGIRVDMVVDGLGHGFDLPVEPIEVILNALAHRSA